MNRTIVLFAVLALVAPGCKKKQVTDPAVTRNDNPTVIKDAVAPLPDSIQDAVAGLVQNFRRVNFEFDTDRLTEDAKRALADNVAILQKHASIEVEVQGHADERGTIEYNLALGQRRAEAVRKYMSSMGVAPNRVRTTTYGEERPLDRGHSEVAWAQNRRAEFRISAGKQPDVRGTID